MKGSTLAKNTDIASRRTAGAVAETRAGLSRDELVAAYRWMLLSRRIDDKEIQLKNQSLIFFQISGAGHEAVCVAAAAHLKPGYDWFYPYYRDRALCLALGMTPFEMMQGAVGAKDDPSSGGRQMPSHWGHRALNIPSQGSPTGTQCLQAVGCGEAGMTYGRASDIADGATRQHGDEVTYVSIGDGATSEGEFWESLNTACTRPVPVLYLVEDNGYAISVPVDVQTPGGDVSRLVESFPNLKVLRCDGTDYLDSYRTLEEAVAWVRRERKPALVHAKVTRPYSHSLSDDERLYKTTEERAAEAARDPLARMRALLLERGHTTETELVDLAAGVDAEIARATDDAIASPKPTVDTAGWWVFSHDVDPTSAAFDTPEEPEGKPDTMVAAINRTLKSEMAHNPRIVVFGEDVADASRAGTLEQVQGKGGVFKVTHGLQRAFGAERVFNSPLAEANIVGRAVGMAQRGIKPVIEIQFFDYIWPAMMQIKDEMSMMRYRSGNNWSNPLVIRVPIGGYLRGGAPYHSQSGVSIFAHCPGIRIVFPSNAADAAGLLRTSIRCDDPVMFLEHKHLYRQTYNKGAYPGDNYMVPFGRGALKRDGTDLVVITWGALVQRSIVAAQQAEKDGISVAVFDLRTIMPFDWDGIAALVKKTNRVIVAHEDQVTCGFGAEIAARISDELFDHLDAPVKRVGAMDCPVAYYPELEEAILPQTSDVLTAIRSLAAY
ncbi:MAG TPA: dehydrogenase E1 component subunit alpha/beta [Vicinamibacterales bacterium]|nr:dehydrogenase E1 component subunit alpha/beta [Vicinamibacterales bacterium]